MALDIKRSMRLTEEQYYQVEYPKDLIVLHHTVGGTAKSTFNWWQGDEKHIATAFIVERDGTIYETFDPKHWAWHIGLKGTGGVHDKRSIGIEIASEGGLKESEGKLYCFDRITPRTEFGSEYYDYGRPWRGPYRYFAAYSTEQVKSVFGLINELCEMLNISRKTPTDHVAYNPDLFDFKGIIGHHHVRTDKTDLHPGFNWSDMISQCDVESV